VHPPGGPLGRGPSGGPGGDVDRGGGGCRHRAGTHRLRGAAAPVHTRQRAGGPHGAGPPAAGAEQAAADRDGDPGGSGHICRGVLPADDPVSVPAGAGSDGDGRGHPENRSGPVRQRVGLRAGAAPGQRRRHARVRARAARVRGGAGGREDHPVRHAGAAARSGSGAGAPMRAGPDRRESLADVVADIRDGTRLALCGFASTRNAVAFAHELVRARRHRLSLTQVIGGMETDLLVAAGAADDLSYGGGSLDRFGPLHAVNRAAMAGTLRLVEYSALALTLRLHAGALGLPFIATRSLLGSDLAQALIAGGHARLAEDPFDGTPCLVLPPLRTDVAVVHVDVADTAGNAVIAGPTWSIPETVRAADTVLVLAEEGDDVGAIAPSHPHSPAAHVHAV